MVLAAGMVISMLIWHRRGEPTCRPSGLRGAGRGLRAAAALPSAFVQLHGAEREAARATPGIWEGEIRYPSLRERRLSVLACVQLQAS